MRLLTFSFVVGLLQMHAQNVPAVPYQPLDAAGRWHNYLNNTFASPGFYFAAAGSASGAHLANDPKEWRQGLKGYGRRTASRLGLFGIEATVHEGGAAILGYDPRYQNCGCKGFFRRTAHAIEWSFLTKNRSGETRFDLPNVAAPYAAGMLSMYWHPARYTPLGDGVRVGTQQLGARVGIDIIREFGPELKRVFRIKR